MLRKKRKYGAALAIIMLANLFLGAMPLGAFASITYTINDNYDNLALGQLTSAPANYYFDQNGGTREVVLDPAGGSNQVLKFTKADTTTSHKTLRWYTPQPTGIFVTQLRVRFPSFETNWGFQLRMSPYAEVALADVIKDGSSNDFAYIYAQNGDSQVKTSKVINKDTWYTISFVINKDAATYSIYVDGTAVGTDYPMQSKYLVTSAIDAFLIKNTHASGSSTMYLDDLRVYAYTDGLDIQPPPTSTPTPTPTATPIPTPTYSFFDNYNNLTLGQLTSAPANYYFDQNGGTREVALDPADSSNQVLKFTKADTSTPHKTFRWYLQQPTGTFTTQLKIRFPSFETNWGFMLRMNPYAEIGLVDIIKDSVSNDFAYINVYDGNTLTKTSKVINKDTWYTLSIAVNKDNSTFSVYVDGVKVGNDYACWSNITSSSVEAFSIKNTHASGSSTMYFDDLCEFAGLPYTEPTPTVTPTPVPTTTPTPEPSATPISYKFFDDYNSLTLGSLNSAPANYYFDMNGGTREVVADPEDSSNKVLKFTKADTTTSHKTLRWYPSDPTGKFTTQIKVRFPSFETNWGFAIRMEPYAEVNFIDIVKDNAGNFAHIVPYTSDPNLNKPTSKVINKDTWYTIDMMVDKDTSTFSVYVNGTKLFGDYPLQTDISSANSLVKAFLIKNTHASGSSSMYFDDLCEYLGEPVEIIEPDLAVASVTFQNGTIVLDNSVIPVYTSKLIVNFNKGILNTTINKDNIKVFNASKQEPVDYSVAANGTKAVEITFNSILESSTNYILTIGTGIMDLNGKPLAVQFTKPFTTDVVPFILNNDKYYNLQGGTVTFLPHSSTICVSVDVTNNSQVNANTGTVVIMLCNSNNEIVNASYYTRSFLPGATETFKAGFNLPDNVIGYKIKIAVWDNIVNRNNMCEMLTFPK